MASTKDDMSHALQWARDVLSAQGILLADADIEPLRDVPWSAVTRLKTPDGNLYLKQTAPLFSIESALMEKLGTLSPGLVPNVIARNPALRCFIMDDAGSVLRDTLKADFQPDLLANALKVYAELQRDVAASVEEYLSMGVMDWRLSELPRLYDGLLAKEESLLTDGLATDELTVLQGLRPRLKELCNALASFNIPETLDHCDFHDNNIMMKQDRIIINDWGDAVIGHPFLSLAGCLSSAGRKHEFTAGDDMYNQLRDAYLSAWSAYGTMDILQQAFALAKILRDLQFSLSFARVLECEGMVDYPQYRGYLADGLRYFIKSASSN